MILWIDNLKLEYKKTLVKLAFWFISFKLRIIFS